MAYKDFDEAKKVLQENKIKTHFHGPISEILVISGEKFLGIKFPQSYFRFLVEFGAGDIESSEIYGIIGENFRESSIPDVVWLTSKYRKEFNFPDHFVPIFDLGDGEIFCIDLRSMDNAEAKIVAFTPGSSNDEQTQEVIAEDFAAFFLDVAKRIY